MADDLPDVVERFVADVGDYVRDLERAAREADRFGDQQEEARERVTRMGHAAQQAAERAARAQAEAAREAEKLAEGTGDAERAARAAARAERELERANIAQARAARAAAQQTDREAEQYAELAREAARAAAAQRLAQLRASGSIREHNQLLRQLREQYGDLGDDTDRTFREMEGRARSFFRGFRENGLKNINPVQAAIVAVPTLAAVAAGAITFGVGAALAGLGIMAAAQNEKVKEEFSDLKKHVVSEVQEWAAPFERTLLDMRADFEGTFDSFGPTLRSEFADLAPVVSEFSDEVTDSFEQFAPVIAKFSDAFQRILADLGPRMDTIVGNLAEGLSELADAAERNPEQFGQLLEDISELARLAGQLSGLLASLSGGFDDLTSVLRLFGDVLGPLAPVLEDAAKSFLAFSNPISGAKFVADKLADSLDQLNPSAQASADAMRQVEHSARGTAGATQQANNQQSRSQALMKLASQSAQQLKTALDELSGKQLTAREAAAQYGQAVINLNKSLKENGRAHGFSTAKGIQNEQALTELARAAQNNAVAMRDNGASAEDVAKFMEKARKKFVAAAIDAGYNRREANKLADQLYGVKRAADSIPKKKHTKVTADTDDAQNIVQRFIGWVGRQVARINIDAIWPFAQGGPVPAFAGGGPVGPIPGYPTGGPVRGPGTGTSDSILARLSSGEFVMTAAAHRMFGPLLMMMNRAASGGGASRSAPAASVPRSTGGAGTVVQYVTNVHVAGSIWSERELLDVVQRQANDRNVRNPGTNLFGGR